MGNPQEKPPENEQEIHADPKKMVETILPYKGENIIIRSREQTSEKGIFRALGNVVVTYKDMRFQADELEYDSTARFIKGHGNVLFKKGIQEIHCDHFEFDIVTKTGQFIQTRGIADNNFRLQAKKVEMVEPNVYVFHNGVVSTCEEEHSDWSFSSSKARIVKDKSATLKHSVFRLFGIPVFYFPWVKFPILEKGRKSGLLIPSVGSSTQKGVRVSQGAYLTLGRSADLVVRGDYFSRRGYGLAFSFRSKFSERSYLNVSTYSVKDNEDEGGSAINIDSFFIFGKGFRATLQANTVTNIAFRRIYSDSFFGAVRPDEFLTGSLTRDWSDYTFDVIMDRRQYYFEESELFSRQTPRISFYIHGRRLWTSPLYLFLDADFTGFTKKIKWEAHDSQSGSSQWRNFRTLGTPLRADIHSRLQIPVKLGKWLRLSLMPWVTGNLLHRFYPEEVPPTPDYTSVSESVFRRYASMDFKVDLPRIFRIFTLFGRPMKHVIETGATWRWISGIDNFSRIVQFDYQDAVVTTNEIEYHIVNRFFIKRNNHAWELFSLSLRQKYFINDDFGGNFDAGHVNQLEPFYTFSPYDAFFYPRRFSPIQLTTRLNPSTRFSGQFRAEFDTLHGRLGSWSVSGIYRNNWLFSSLAYLNFKPFDPGAKYSNYLQTSVGIGRENRGWSADVNVSYNLENTNLDNIYLRLNYFTNCLGISAEYLNFDIHSRKRDNELRFSLFLKGIGRFGKLRSIGRRMF